MNDRLTEKLGGWWEFSRQWIDERRGEFVRCGQCDNEVKFLEDVCPHCGASSPARVAPSLLILVAGVIAVIQIAGTLL